MCRHKIENLSEMDHFSRQAQDGRAAEMKGRPYLSTIIFFKSAHFQVPERKVCSDRGELLFKHFMFTSHITTC